MLNQAIYVSATPADYEFGKSEGAVVEQLIRPTGLMDPVIVVRPARSQVDDLLDEIRKRVERKERVLVTTLTKRMAEDLTEYYQDLNVKVRYLHSDIETIERVEIIRQLRSGQFDVLVGINLLREGLDLPEVSLVAILDADKEGFLRSDRSLIQTIGRAARNVFGTVILYADSMTDSMKRAIDETERRRRLQGGVQQKTRHHAAVDHQSSGLAADQNLRRGLCRYSHCGREGGQVWRGGVAAHDSQAAKRNETSGGTAGLRSRRGIARSNSRAAKSGTGVARDAVSAGRRDVNCPAFNENHYPPRPAPRLRWGHGAGTSLCLRQLRAQHSAPNALWRSLVFL